MLILGGTDGDRYLDDVWALALDGVPAWTRLTPSRGPIPGRAGHAAVYDPVADRVIIIGGRTSSGPSEDAWSLSLRDGAAWVPLQIPRPSPGELEGHAAVYDPVRRRVLVIAPRAFSGPRTSASWHALRVWSLRLQTPPSWENLDPSGVRESSGMAAVKLLAMGPLSSGPSGGVPEYRKGFAAVYDPVEDLVLVNGGDLLNDDTSSETWVLELRRAPAGRRLKLKPN
ncbi:MAG TPA: kelch repeat-containing protein [Candidatus Eisenbacteria bacterium]|jgi:hypothetical protein